MGKPLPHDYFYGNEADQYMFIRFPKALITNAAYRELSDGSKILYGLMLDRMSLSIKNGWQDEVGRAYIIFTLEAAQEQMNCGHNKGVKMMMELEKIGLIERRKQGLGRPAVIYVKKFLHEQRVEESRPNDDNPQGNTDFRKEEVKTSDYGKSRLPHQGSADFPISEANKTDLNKTDISKTNPIQSYPAAPQPDAPQEPDGMGLDRINAYRNLIMENIEYDILVERHGRERVDELVELMVDTVCSNREYITIASDDYPKEVVKSRLLKLGSSHAEYVFDSIDRNTTKVRNIRKYLLSALYNAPTTMDSYYRAEVNHDLYGGGGR